MHGCCNMAANLDLRYIAAPMVNQSDTPFRALVHHHGATLTYTEMLKPARLLSDPDYLAFHRRALESGRTSTGPVVVQVCGNDQDVIVRGAKTVVDLCDGIGTCLVGGQPDAALIRSFTVVTLSCKFSACQAMQI
jgi:tRNA-dihydrouridine synthase